MTTYLHDLEIYDQQGTRLAGWTCGDKQLPTVPAERSEYGKLIATAPRIQYRQRQRGKVFIHTFTPASQLRLC